MKRIADENNAGQGRKACKRNLQRLTGQDSEKGKKGDRGKERKEKEKEKEKEKGKERNFERKKERKKKGEGGLVVFLRTDYTPQSRPMPIYVLSVYLQYKNIKNKVK